MSRPISIDTAINIKKIYEALAGLKNGEELTIRQITEVVGKHKGYSSSKIGGYIDSLCDLGFTIAEDCRGNKTYYSLLPSIDNKILYRKHFEANWV